MSTNHPLQELKSRIKFRDEEFDLLNAFISTDLDTCVPVLMVQGYRSIGKSLVVNQFLDTIGAKTTIVKADEIMTTKMFLQSCLRDIRNESGADLELSKEFYDKGNLITKLSQTCDNFASFQYNLSKFIKETNYHDQHFLVIDRLDQFMDDAIQMFNAFSRLRDSSDIKNICIIFITGLETSHEIVTSSIPTINFKPYTEQQIIKIFQDNQFCYFGEPDLDNSTLGKQFWNSFVQVIVDLFFEYSGSNLSILSDLCFRKWPMFIDTIIKGEYSPTQFLKLYRENKEMFLDDSLSNASVQNYKTSEYEQGGSAINLQEMTNLTKFILIASYLASYIDPRNDMHYFASIEYSALKGIRKFQKKTELTKKDMDNRLLQPNFFDLERLYAILLVIYRNNTKSFDNIKETFALDDEIDDIFLTNKGHEISKFSLAGNIDLHAQVAILLNRGLLLRQMTRDILQPKTRWKCNTSWETIEALCKDVDFDIKDYLDVNK